MVEVKFDLIGAEATLVKLRHYEKRTKTPAVPIPDRVGTALVDKKAIVPAWVIVSAGKMYMIADLTSAVDSSKLV